MSRNVLTSGTSYTNPVAAPTETNVLLNNGDGDIIVRAADELKLEASRMSIKLGTAQAGQVLTTDGTRCSWQSLPSTSLNTTAPITLSYNNNGATYGNNSIVYNSPMTLTAPSIQFVADLLDSYGTSGSAGNVLTHQGGRNLRWETPTNPLTTNTVDIGATTSTNLINLGRSTADINCLSKLRVHGPLIDGFGGQGNSSEVLTSTGSGVQWVNILRQSNVTIGGTTPSNEVNLGAQSTSTLVRIGCSFVIDGTRFNSTTNLNGKTYINSGSTLYINGGLHANNTTGTAGQVLTSTSASEVRWTTLSSVQGTAVKIGTDSTSGTIEVGPTTANVKTTINSEVELKKAVYDRLGNVGSNGQVLTSTVNGVQWTTPSSSSSSSSSGLPATVFVISNTTSVNEYPTFDLTKVKGIIFISSQAGTTASRSVFFPLDPPAGYIISVTNLSGASWVIRPPDSGVKFLGGANTQDAVNINTNVTGRVFTYVGSIGGSLKYWTY